MAKKYYASDVIKVAESQVGYKETGTNITKYAKDFDTKWPNFYNTKKQGSEWCDIFVDWCFVTAFGESAAKKLLCQPSKSCGAGVTFSYDYYKSKKQTGSTPKVGAQIFFQKSKSAKKPCHTGLVYKVDSKKVYTIEGNKDNQVKKCSYTIGSDKIFGYGYPKFDADPTSQTAPAAPADQTVPAKPTDPNESGNFGLGNTKKYIKCTVTADNGLNIRTGRTVLHKSLGVMLKGATFYADDTSKSWYHGYSTISGKKVTGWASSKYLKK